MCGICGFFSLGGPLPHGLDGRALLGRMCGTIVHRGPDAEGAFTDGLAALGIRRLAIIDLTSGDQPQFNEDGGVAVVFNGEIYNYHELREELAGKGHLFKTSSDTEVIVHLYEELGEAFVDRLNGMFAVALYDKKKGLLLLVRDRMGKKPLHYASVGGCLVFGSEIKSLLQFPGIDRTLSPEALYNYLTFEYVSAPRSIFRSIHKLLPGQMMVAKPGSPLKLVKYWKPRVEKKRYGEEELAGLIRETFFTSVRQRLYSDVPLGVFLSGGIDSTLVTGAASTFVSGLKTFSIGFREETFNELEYARAASGRFKTDHTEMILSYQKAIDLLPVIMGFLDEPLADASIIPTYLVSSLSKPKITVALAGEGGDELFLGYDTYKAYKIARYARWLPHLFVDLGSLAASLLPVSSKRLSLEFKAKKFLSGLKYKPEISNYLWWGAYTPEAKRALLTGDFLARLRDFPEFEPVLFYEDDLKDIADPLDRVNVLDLNLYLQDNLLVKVDRMSMATSLEVRCPFLDYRMVELALSIDNDLRMSGLRTKHIIKKALADLIPDKIMRRPKVGFDIPLGSWLRENLREHMLSLLDSKKIREAGIFNPAAVEKIVAEHLAGRHNHRQLLWPLMIFQNWLEIYRPALN